MINSKLEYPEIFITGELPKGWTKQTLIADAFSGWGCCMAGAQPPDKFGLGMMLIGT